MCSFGSSGEASQKGVDNERIVDFLKQKIRETSKGFDVDVLNIECDGDHFHCSVN